MNHTTQTQETARSNNLTESMKIACCKACLLAERMKDCKNCPFNIGLTAGSQTKEFRTT